MTETNPYPVLPLQVGLDIMSRFRRSAVASGKWNWVADFPYSNVAIHLDYSAFSAIVWSLLNSVNNSDLPYADRKNSYSVLGTIAEEFGYILPAFKVPGYPNVTAEECKA